MSISQQTLKRITKEKAMMDKNPVREFHAEPTEENALEWHFTMLGPPDSPYAEGLYHGRILIPHEYPFKPPDVVLLTPNGRFELDKRICLSVSSYHPEHWHPTWGIQTVLNGLREFMLTPGNNAIGAIEYPSEVRARLALESRNFVCAHCKVKVKQLWEEVMMHRPSMASITSPSAQAAPPPTPQQTQQPPAPGGDGVEPLSLPPAVDVPPGEKVPPPVSSPAAAPAVAPPNTPPQSQNAAAPPHAQVPAAVPAPAAAAPPAPAPPPPPFIRRNQHNGGIDISIPVELVDRLLFFCLALFGLLLFKKLAFDWRSTVAGVFMSVGGAIGNAAAGVLQQQPLDEQVPEVGGGGEL